ncbi:hypothetical protein BDW67DRAFT_88589 [Aspergillus spinulosporus]
MSVVLANAGSHHTLVFLGFFFFFFFSEENCCRFRVHQSEPSIMVAPMNRDRLLRTTT